MGMEMIWPTIATATTAAKRISTGRQLFLTNRNQSLIFSLGVRTTEYSPLSKGFADRMKTQTVYTMQSRSRKL